MFPNTQPVYFTHHYKSIEYRHRGDLLLWMWMPLSESTFLKHFVFLHDVHTLICTVSAYGEKLRELEEATYLLLQSMSYD